MSKETEFRHPICPRCGQWLSEQLSDLSMWLMGLSLALRPLVSDEEFAAACERVATRCEKDASVACGCPEFCETRGCQL